MDVCIGLCVTENKCVAMNVCLCMYVLLSLSAGEFINSVGID